MTTIHVSDQAGLLAALAKAEGGDEIVLADGDYGTLTLNGKWGANILPYASPVTITSATPGGAKFDSVKITSGTNLSFDGIDVAGEFRAVSSSNIAVTDSIGTKLSFRDVDGLTLSGNHVSGGDYTLILYSVANFAITGNTFEKASNDLIQISRNSYNGLIENNVLNDVIVTNPKAHPDLIQIFGYDGMNPHDITIRGNYLYDDPATGLNVAQGIFLSNPTGEGFRNMLIEDNLVSVRSPNTIFVSGGEENVVIRNNSLIAGPEGMKGGVIRLKDSTALGFDNAGVTVEGNIASRIADETRTSTIGDNLLYDSHQNSPFQGDGARREDFLLSDATDAGNMGARVSGPVSQSPADTGAEPDATDAAGSAAETAPEAGATQAMPPPEAEAAAGEAGGDAAEATETGPAEEAATAADAPGGSAPEDAGLLAEAPAVAAPARIAAVADLDLHGSLTVAEKWQGILDVPVHVAATPELAVSEATLALTFAADTVSYARGLVSRDSAGLGHGLSAWIQDGTLNIAFEDGATRQVVSQAGITAGTGHALQIAFGDGQGRVWLDGTLIGTVETGIDWQQNGDDLTVGAENSRSTAGGHDALRWGFIGDIRDVVLYDAALTPAELAALSGDAGLLA